MRVQSPESGVLSRIAPTLIAAVAGALLLSGCGTMGGRQASNNDRPEIHVYHIENLPNSRPMVNIGNAAINAPMYHSPEGTVENPADNPANGVVTAGPGTTPATLGTVAGVGVGKFVIVSGASHEGQSANRSAESDVAAALQIAKDLAQSAAGQTPTTTQREGTTTGTSTQTSTPTKSDTTTVAPNTPITGAGDSAVTNPGANASGAGGSSGSASGGTGDANNTPAPAPAPAPTPAPQPPAPPVSLLAPLPGLAPTSAQAKNGSPESRPVEDTAAIDYHHPAKHPGGHVLKGGIWQACPGPDCTYQGTVMPDDYLHTDPNAPISPANLARMK